MKISGFFKGMRGELSSRRLGLISSLPFTLLGTIWICDRLINCGRPELAVEVWKCFYIYCGVLGGYVTMETLYNFLSLIKGIPKEVKIDSKLSKPGS